MIQKSADPTLEGVSEDPHTLTLGQWFSRVLRLPVRELAARSFGLSASTARNLVLLPRLIRRAKKAGRRLRIIVLADRLGDIIAAEPTLRALKNPGDEIAWLVRPRFADLLRFNPEVDHIVPVTSYTEAALLKCLFGRPTWNVLYKHGMSCNVFGFAVNNPNAVNLDD